MKTPEEIRLAVLKECKLLCPNIGAQHWITDDVLVEMSSPDHWEFRGRGEPYGMCSISSGAINTQWKVEMAYRLLNLEAKEIRARAQGLAEVVQKVVETNRNHDWPWHEPSVIMGDIEQMTDTLEAALDQWKGVQHV